MSNRSSLSRFENSSRYLTVIGTRLHGTIALIRAHFDILVRFRIIHGDLKIVGSDAMNMCVAVGEEATLDNVDMESFRSSDEFVVPVTFYRAMLQYPVACGLVKMPIVQFGQSNSPHSRSTSFYRHVAMESPCAKRLWSNRKD